MDHGTVSIGLVIAGVVVLGIVATFNRFYLLTTQLTPLYLVLAVLGVMRMVCIKN